MHKSIYIVFTPILRHMTYFVCIHKTRKYIYAKLKYTHNKTSKCSHDKWNNLKPTKRKWFFFQNLVISMFFHQKHKQNKTTTIEISYSWRNVKTINWYFSVWLLMSALFLQHNVFTFYLLFIISSTLFWILSNP